MKRRRTLMEAVEPRLLFSADPAAPLVDALAPAPPEAELHADLVRPSAAEVRRELVVVDGGVEGHEALVADLRARETGRVQLEILVLDPDRDGVAQVSEALARQEAPLDAVHLVSHGSASELSLGKTRLTADGLGAFESAIAGWKGALAEDADLLVYGCNLAAGEDGRALLARLGELTGADLAASDDVTGLGGDWQLEVQTGFVAAATPFSSGLQQQWQGTLALVAVTDYLDSDGEPLASTQAAPGTTSTPPVPDFDGDGKQGRTVQKSSEVPLYSEGAATKQQLWHTDASGFLVDGNVSFRLWGAMLDFAADKEGDVWAFLTEADTGGGNALSSPIASDQILVPAFGWGPSFDELVFDFGSVTHAVMPGRTLAVKVVVGDTAGGDMMFAYDTAAHQARIEYTKSTSAPPTISGLGGDSGASYVEEGAPVLVEQGGDVLVGDPDAPPDFDDGLLRVLVASGGSPGEDSLSVRHQGMTSGLIGFVAGDVFYGGTQIGTASGGTGGAPLDISLNANADTVSTAALIENVTYQNTNSEDPSETARTVRFQLHDGDGGFSADYDVSVAVAGINDAPTLGNASLVAVDQDTANPPGDTVAALFASSFGDVDSGASFSGIAVVGNAASGAEGVWQYSSDGGSNWADVGSVNDTGSALAIQASSLLRFLPAPGYQGTPTDLVLRGLDDAYGGSWSTTTGGPETRVALDTSSPGGTTPVAAATSVLSTSILSLNDARIWISDQGSDVLEFTPTELEAPDTAGSFASTFDASDFGSGFDFDALHYVGTAMGVGGVGLSAIGLQPGDVLFSVDAAGTTLTGLNSLAVQGDDVVHFRPQAPGDYSNGTFSMFAPNLGAGWFITAFSLVETNTTIPSYGAVAQGSFLYTVVDASGNGRRVLHYDPTTGGSNVVVAGNFDEEGLQEGGLITGIDLVETPFSAGGRNFNAGQIILGLANFDDEVGTNGLSVWNEDLFVLDLASPSSWTATRVFNGSDVDLGRIWGVSFTPDAGTGGPGHRAPTLDTTGPYVFSDIAEDTTGGSGDSVSDLLMSDSNPNSITDPDILSLEGIVVTAVDDSDGTWQFRIGSGSWQDVGAVSSTSALVLRNGDDLRFVPDSDFSGTRTVSFRAWDETDGTNAGTKVNPGPGGGSSAYSTATASASLTVTPVNDAPSIADAVLTSVDEDTANPPGETIDALFSGSFSDPDGTFEGVAVDRNNAPASEGSWQYSSDGANWFDVGSVGSSNALLLEKGTRLRFLPAADFNGDPTRLRLRAVDDTYTGSWSTTSSGEIRVTTSTSSNGDGTPFEDTRTDLDTAIDPENDAPTATDGTLATIAEGTTNPPGATLASLFGGSFSDPDAGAGFSGVAVIKNNALVSEGVWQYSSDAGANWEAIGAVDDGPSALALEATTRVRFLPETNFSGSVEKLRVRVMDETYSGGWSTTTGGTETRVNVDSGLHGDATPISDDKSDVEHTVSDINDAPTIGDALLAAVDEDTANPPGASIDALYGAGFSDPDGTFAGIAVVGNTAPGSEGVWQYSSDAGANWAAVASVDDAANALALEKGSLIRFLPAADFSGIPVGLELRAIDDTYAGAWSTTTGGSETRITTDVSARGDGTPYEALHSHLDTSINAINDAPSLANASLASVDEDTTSPAGDTIGNLFGPGFSDPDGGDSLSGVAVVGNSAPGSQGAWQYSSDGGSTWADVASVTDGSTALAIQVSSRLRFLPAADFNGAPADLVVRGLDSSYAGGWSTTAGAETRVTVDTTSPGGTTPIAAATADLDTVIDPVNDAPVLDSTGLVRLSPVPVNETDPVGDAVAALIAAAGGDRITDVDDSPQEGIAVVSVDDSRGTWQYSIDGGSSWLGFGGVTSGSAVLLDDAARIRFVPTANLYGEAGEIQFHAWDRTSGASGDTGVNVAPTGGTTAFSTATETAGVYVVGNPKLLLTTHDDVTAGGQTGASTWQEGDLIGIADPALLFERTTPTPQDTSGTFSIAFDIDAFSLGARTSAVHMVSRDLQIGNQNFQLRKGDLILALRAGATLTSEATTTTPGFASSLVVAGPDVFVFRPDSPGDYGAGTFALLLENPMGNTLRGLTLVEASTPFGDTVLDAGDFLVTVPGPSVHSNVYLYQTEDIGAGPTVVGVPTPLLEGGDPNISIGTKIYGLDLLEDGVTIGGRTLAQGTLLMSTGDPDNVGMNGLGVDDSDIFALTVTKTSLVAGSGMGEATASLFFDGSDVAFGDPAEKLDGFTLLETSNSSPVITPAGPSFTAIDEDQLTNPGDTVGSIIAGTVSDSDPGAARGVAVTGLVSGGGTWQYSTDAGSSWLPVGGVSVGNALLLRDVDRLRFVPDGDNGESPDPSVSYRAWDQTSGAAGTKTDVSGAGSGSAFSVVGDTASIEVSSVNDSPGLGNAILASVDEDTSNPPGALISALFGAGFVDVDAGASLAGVAVVGNTAPGSEGTWQYSSNGSDWFAIGAVADDATALAIEATSRVRFLPAADYNGSPTSLVLRGVDDSYGGAWSVTGGSETRVTVDTTTPGGTTPVAAATSTLSTSIAAVNDAPVLDPSGLSRFPAVATNDSDPAGTSVAALLASAGDPISDVDSAVEGIAVIAVDDAHGTWEHSTDGGGSWTGFGAASTTAAVLLDEAAVIRFVPDPDYFGPGGAIKFHAWDQSAGSNGQTGVNATLRGADTAFSTAEETAGIWVSGDPQLWLSTSLDVAAGGQTGVATWDRGDVVALADPGLALERDNPAQDTDGTFGIAFDIEAFAPDARTDGVHVVGRDLQVGSSAFQLRAGDLLLSLDNGETLTSESTATAPGFSNSLDVGRGDVFVFRPDTAGDYGAGTFAMLLEDPLGGNLRAFTLIEADTRVGDVTLDAGDFLLVRDGSTEKSVTLWETGDVGPIPATSGTPRLLLDGDDLGVQINDKIFGIELIEEGFTTGGRPLAEGTLLLSVDGADLVGDGALPVEEFDIFALEVRKTTLGSGVGNGEATASLFFDGGDVGFDDPDEGIDGFSLVAQPNTAPTLTPANPDFTAIDEDQTSNTGDDVASLLGASVSDPDAGAARGIAVTGLTSGGGTWEFSTDGGSSWTGLGSASDASALTLRDVDRLRFVPDGENGESPDPTVTYRAWDQTQGKPGARFDASTPGPTDSFSAATDTASIEVSAVNDAPTLGDASLGSVPEDTTNPPGATISGLFGAGFGDVDSGASFGGVAIVGNTAPASQGTWQYSSDAGTSWADIGSVGDDATALAIEATSRLRFLAAADWNGTPADLTLRGLDDSYSGSWSTTTAGTETRALTDTTSTGGTTPIAATTSTLDTAIDAVSDAPTLGDATLASVPEDTTSPPGDLVSALFGAGFGDVDGDSFAGVAIVGNTAPATEGVWQYSSDGTNWSAVGTVADDATALAVQATSRLRFVPATDYNGTPADLVLRGLDQTYSGGWSTTNSGESRATLDTSSPGGTTPIAAATSTLDTSIDAVNDAPTLGDATLGSVPEDSTNPPGALVSALFGTGFGDVDSGATFGGIAIVGNTAPGTEGVWQYSSDGTNWFAVGTVADDATALAIEATSELRFLPATGFNGAPADLVLRGLDDSYAGGWSTTSSGESRTTVDTSSPGGASPIAAAPSSLDTAITSSNDSPTLGNASLTSVDEDATNPPGATVVALFGSSFVDPDTGSSFGGVALVGNTALPADGVWQYSSDAATWAAVGTVGDDATALALQATSRLRFLPAADYHGSPPDLVLRGLDDTYSGGWSTTAGSETRVTLDTSSPGSPSAIAAATSSLSTSIDSVNDPPSLDDAASYSLTDVDEDTPAPAGDSVGAILASPGAPDRLRDADSGALEGIAVTGADGSNGTWQFKIGSGPWTNVGSVSSSNALLLRDTDLLRFVPAADYEGPSGDLLFRGWDRSDSGLPGSTANPGVGGGSSAFSAGEASASLNVLPINDAPVLDGTSPFRGTSVAEGDTDPGGDRVSNLLAAAAPPDRLTDVDTGALEGIAVVSVDDSNGTWQYKVGAGPWTDVGTVGASNALLLRDTDLVRFVPDTTYTGPAGNLVFRAWDRSDGTLPGSKLDPGAPAPASAFSADTGTVRLDVASTPPITPDPDPDPDPDPTPGPDPGPVDDPDPTAVAPDAGPGRGRLPSVTASPPPTFEGAGPPERARLGLAVTEETRSEVDHTKPVREYLERQYFEGADAFLGELNRLREAADRSIQLGDVVTVSSLGLATTLSIGYVVWLTQGGLLVASLMSSMPAWRLIDPLPVLAGRRQGGEDDESLGSMLEASAEEPDGPEPPESGTGEPPGEGSAPPSN